MSDPKPKLTEAQHDAYNAVLDFYDHPKSVRTGSFMQTLALAFSKADPSNRAKLAMGFPEMAEAMRMANESGGLDRLADHF